MAVCHLRFYKLINILAVRVLRLTYIIVQNLNRIYQSVGEK